MDRKQIAVVIGGGISGKLAARVLSDFFREVVILERDAEPKGPFPRKGVPQGEHLHALLMAGERGLESLFPGITDQYQLNGAVKINSTHDLAWYHHGVWKLRYKGRYTSILQSRPQLEWQIEQNIKKIPNVTIHYNQVVKSFILNETQNRIDGVESLDGNAVKKTWNADLIVDASGVSNLSISWLNKHSLQIPEQKVQIGLTYITKKYNFLKTKTGIGPLS
ncbi:FAD-dependent oxidoreductase [Neobacillus endophyticus]|uniref:FAD-dependent oxidoreductase n=1 Tax=Neobacillus endophyticus TaxID=2738405 RepID=UPI001FE30AE2|nr:hypothetical protein [Neobacillus endophyticus]